MMDGRRKSDRSVVPKKFPNNDRQRSTEGMEGRELAEGNPVTRDRVRTQSRESLHHELDRVRRAARRDKGLRFTTLWHHVYNVERLRAAYYGLKRDAAPGIDGETWTSYGRDLETNLQELSGRLRRGAYRAKAVRRVYIPKADGRQRPLGIPVLEDKMVQRATVEVLQAIYEEDFLGFSYGFRPGRGTHKALDALSVGIAGRKVSWVLDADIRGFFDAVNHEWLVKFVEHRIGDRRVVRHVKKWLKAGVLEDGRRIQVEGGTPQGGSISPLLANTYLHYVFDLWIQRWRKTHARGEVIVVRYADDVVAGFQYRSDAEQCLEALRRRFQKFSLELHPEKTRLIEFGRFAAENRRRRGEGKPETFAFLGFWHICDRRRNGTFIVLRQTRTDRMRAKLQDIKRELRRRLHDPIPEVGQWLRSVVRGHIQYYGVPRNGHALKQFCLQVARLWYRTLRRRSQTTRLTWERMQRLIYRWLPRPRIVHPYPEQRLGVYTQGKSPVR
jgi:group II intron reverse transcriptase/maturase